MTPIAPAPSRRRLLGLMAGVALAGCRPAPDRPAPITVFAAASLTDALTEAARRFETGPGGAPARLSFAASGAVAQQVLRGAPADLVVLADEPWMDRLVEARAVDAASRVDLVGNRLVVIAPQDAEPGVVVRPLPFDWGRAEGARIVIGDPDSVPAGAYAREMLTRAGLWDEVRPRLVTAADVRAVRAFVQRGEAPLGVVYLSDTVGAPGVRIVHAPSDELQPRIVYPAALVPGAPAPAAAFLTWLGSGEGQALFARYGFTTPGRA